MSPKPETNTLMLQVPRWRPKFCWVRHRFLSNFDLTVDSSKTPGKLAKTAERFISEPNLSPFLIRIAVYRTALITASRGIDCVTLLGRGYARGPGKATFRFAFGQDRR